MILVPSHRLRLSGSKLIAIVVLLFTTAACAPKLRVLKPGGAGTTVPNEKPEETPGKKEEADKESAAVTNHIALLLPFELDKANVTSPGLNDVKRSSLALDFYQGFKTGLDDLARQGANFQLNVLDTRDNLAENSRLASLAEVTGADIIIGPVYPAEISAFANAAKLEKTLQISPLAASKPSEFNVSNLVSITASIDQHISALAFRIIKDHHSGDKLILVDAGDDDSQKFIQPLDSAIRTQSKGLIKPVLLNEPSINEAALQNPGKNVVVSGSANKYTVASLLEKLASLADNGFSIQLYGHPNWAKLGLTGSYLKQLNTRITASYYIDEQAENVKSFVREYTEAYQVPPTEFAFKGYDAGKFFGQLLHKYGKEYPAHLTEETYVGLHNQFRFAYNPEWGYTNTAIRLLAFDGRLFKPF